MTGWRTIGVIGGMGPAATVAFLGALVTAARSEWAAAHDSGHPRVLVDSNPNVPDRNAALAGGASPGPVLADMAARLMAQGAEVLAMPCNAAHGWADAVRAVAGECFVDIVDTAVAAAMAHRPLRIGVIAIGATLDARLYDRAPVPVIAADRGLVQPLVDRIKGGDTGADVAAAMAAIAADLVAAGADVIIAACTEVPMVLRAAPVPLIDSTAALAAATVAAARR